jgi:LysR family hydrogen peroxide-inducible transcriptional activator
MSEKRQKNLRSFTSLKPLREVSLVYSRHISKHKLINLMWREIVEDLPQELHNKQRGSVVEWK